MLSRFRQNQANKFSLDTFNLHHIMATTHESRQLNTLVRSCGGTDDGAKWLKLAVDPFHDVDLELVGFPDQTPGRSVIYNVTKNITISKPEDVTDGKFDAHVSFLPIVRSTPWKAHHTTRTAGGWTNVVKQDEEATEMPTGVIQVCTVPQGKATFRGASYENYDSLDFESLLDTDGSSIARLVGCAFEVHNTTEELHKSGAVTVYRYDNNKDTEAITIGSFNGGAEVSRTDAFNSTVVHGPPTVETNAKLLNGVTWEAADGCLVPIVMDTSNEPQKLLPRRNHMIVEAEGDENLYWMMKGVDDTATFFGTQFTRHYKSPDPSMILPFMGAGAYFTGLSSQTTLTVTMRAFVEVFPGPGNDLVPLAHPSTPYDSKVLQCYSEIMSQLHAGYPVHDNAAGDYFRKALSALKTAVHIGEQIPMAAPFASAVSAGIQAGEDIVKMAGGKGKKKKNGNGAKRNNR